MSIFKSPIKPGRIGTLSGPSDPIAESSFTGRAGDKVAEPSARKSPADVHHVPNATPKGGRKK